jgi:uncharacterized delta-60 repeat protein
MIAVGSPVQFGSGALFAGAALLAIALDASGAPAGSTDDFHPAADGSIRVAILDNGGNLLLAGSFANIGSPPLARDGIARVSPSGAVDVSFAPEVEGGILALAVQGDGAILAGGSFSSISGKSIRNLARLYANGQIDESFNPDVNGSVECLLVQADGKILVGGNFSKFGTAPATEEIRDNLARLNADGSVDASFRPFVPGTSDIDNPVYCMEFDDAKLLLGGDFQNIDGQPRNHLARVSLADGAPDATYTPNVDGVVFDISPWGTTKFLICGEFATVNGAARTRIASLDLAGTLDPWNPPAPDDIAFVVEATSDGKVLVGGEFRNLGATARRGLARIDGGAFVDPAFDALLGGPVRDLAIQSGDQKIVVAGSFRTAGDRIRERIARLHSVATPDVFPGRISVRHRNRILANRTGKVKFRGVRVRRLSGVETLRIENTGGDTLNVMAAVLSGPHRREFSATPPARHLLAPGVSTTVGLRYRPRARGNRSARVEIRSNAGDIPNFFVKIEGRGI